MAEQMTTSKPTSIEVVDCRPTSFVTPGKVYRVVGWHGKSPEVECDHGPVVYLSKDAIWRAAQTGTGA